MTPFMAVIVVVWATGNPAMPNDRSAPIYREVFPDKQICEISLEDKVELAAKTYAGIPGVKLLYGCVPADGKGA